MTHIDFYILPNPAIQHRYFFACRLIEKAYKLGHNIYVNGSSTQQLAKLDQLLWSFKASSFIPHRLHDEESKPVNTKEVLLGTTTPPDDYHGLLINLSNSVPSFFSRFERLSEIVIEHEAIKAATRDNYRFYRERGYHVKTHALAEQTMPDHA